MIPYAKQSINQNDINAVIDVLNSDWLTQGPMVPKFEKSVSDYCNVKYAVAVNSGTSALHIACLALGLGQGDRLWTSPNTFVASANCALYCGATVDFVDIDHKTYNISIDNLRQKLELSERENTLPKILIVVHFAGQPCEMDKLKELADQYKFNIIEDASHALGAKYKGLHIGSCKHSDITLFSFHPVKMITTGEGGMATTNSDSLHEKMILLRSHGVTRDSALMDEKSHGPWFYQQLILGFNYRMTDIQAALGINQMRRLGEFIERRREIATVYNKAFQKLPVVTPWQHTDNCSSFHLYVIRLELDKITKTHRQVFDDLRKAEIDVNLHYIPVHTHPFYRKLGFNYGDFPEAESYYREAVSLPIFCGLNEDEQKYIIDVLKLSLFNDSDVG